MPPRLRSILEAQQSVPPPALTPQGPASKKGLEAEAKPQGAEPSKQGAATGGVPSDHSQPSKVSLVSAATIVHFSAPPVTLDRQSHAPPVTMYRHLLWTAHHMRLPVTADHHSCICRTFTAAACSWLCRHRQPLAYGPVGPRSFSACMASLEKAPGVQSPALLCLCRMGSCRHSRTGCSERACGQGKSPALSAAPLPTVVYPSTAVCQATQEATPRKGRSRAGSQVD